MAHDETFVNLTAAETRSDITHYKLQRLMIEYRRQGVEPFVKAWFARTYSAGGSEPWPEGISLSFQIKIGDPDFATFESATIGSGAVGSKWLTKLAERLCNWLVNTGSLPAGSVVTDDTVPDE